MLNTEQVFDDVRIMSLKGSSVSSYRGKVDQYLPYGSWMDAEDEDFLFDINVTHRNSAGKRRCTAAGLLMLGEESEIVSVYPKFLLSYSEYDSLGRTVCQFSSKTFGSPENLYDFYLEVSERITSGIKPSYLLVDGYETNNSSIHRSLRELLAMALISADFTQPGGVDVMRTPTVISISYPGAEKERMEQPLQTAMRLGMSHTLIKLFNLFGVLEPRVTRSRNVLEVWNKQGWKKPIITQQMNPDRVTATYPLK